MNKAVTYLTVWPDETMTNHLRRSLKTLDEDDYP
jgi:hypothetical protein